VFAICQLEGIGILKVPGGKRFASAVCAQRRQQFAQLHGFFIWQNHAPDIIRRQDILTSFAGADEFAPTTPV
jgi:hypothetical protein